MKERRLRYALALLSAFALAGCAASNPMPVSDSPQSITLQSNVASGGGGRAAAQDHCQAWGLHAVPESAQETGAGHVEHFACR